MGLVWEYFDPQRAGAPLELGLALADEADDLGRGIFQSVPTLARKTWQTERAVRGQLRRLEEGGIVQCVQRSVGGAGKWSEYRLDLSAVVGLKNPEPDDKKTRKLVQGSGLENPEAGAGLAAPHIKDLKEENVRDRGNPEADAPKRTAAGIDTEDERLARWMLDQIRKLNPKHREPSWRSWLRDLRLMRERDGRTRREIAELFGWANADAFWRSNILSPAKLREKWDQLQIQRRTRGGAHPSGLPGDDTTDWRCFGLIEGARCDKRGTWQDPQGRAWCPGCREKSERNGTRPGAPQGESRP